MDLLIATQNRGKIRELNTFLQTSPYKLLSLADVSLGDFDVEETGTTFEANATLKATIYGDASGKITISDDGGLVIDALNGEPGVYSARYGDPSWTFDQKISSLLERMQDIPEEKRTARFVCVLAIYHPQKRQLVTLEGICEGSIPQQAQKGNYGFAYDPIFIPAGYDRSFSQLTPDIKNGISHRARAMQGVQGALEKMLAEEA